MIEMAEIPLKLVIFGKYMSISHHGDRGNADTCTEMMGI
jgi:hypothetical protein